MQSGHFNWFLCFQTERTYLLACFYETACMIDMYVCVCACVCVCVRVCACVCSAWVCVRAIITLWEQTTRISFCFLVKTRFSPLCFRCAFQRLLPRCGEGGGVDTPHTRARTLSYSRLFQSNHFVYPSLNQSSYFQCFLHFYLFVVFGASSFLFAACIFQHQMISCNYILIVHSLSCFILVRHFAQHEKPFGQFCFQVVTFRCHFAMTRLKSAC